MKKYYYDLHLHSCLSPCGDEDNTPCNIVGMAKLSGLDVIALTDHNSCKNCTAFFSVAKRMGLIPIAGMELTTSEDIHIVCLFEELEKALAFDEYINERRLKIKNKPEFFGRQIVLDAEDNLISEIDDLLINATNISVSEIKDTVEKYDGVCYPAHIDRESNGIIAVLGALPKEPRFDFFELHDGARINEFSTHYGIPKDRFIVSSDAHYLTDIKDGEFYFEICESTDECEIRRQIFEILRSVRR